MKVKSTGLGKTQLQCHFDGFQPKENGEDSVVMVITSTEPVHWHIEADLGGKDLRQMAGQMLTLGTIWHVIKLLVKGSEARGFVMEKESGRRSTRERVVRTATTAPSGAEPLAAATPAPVAEPTAPIQPAAVAATQAPRRVASARVDDSDQARREREERRAERRRAREERAAEYATS